MPICIMFIKVMQMHWIILFFCNTQVGLIVTILSHLFHLCNTLWTHWQYNIQPTSHMHYPHQSNANALDYFVVMQNSCLGYISYHLIKQCNTLWTHWQYHIQQYSHLHTFITIMHILYTILVFCNTLRPIEIISFYLIKKCNTLKKYWK